MAVKPPLNIVLGGMDKHSIAVGVALFLVTSCAASSPSNRLGVLVVATTADVVYVGRAYTKGRTGTFKMASLTEDPTQCAGTFRYFTNEKARAKYRCSDQQNGSLKIESTGYLVGSGSGDSSTGRVDLVFGYSLAKVNQKLTFPAGTRLEWRGADIVLVEYDDS